MKGLNASAKPAAASMTGNPASWKGLIQQSGTSLCSNQDFFALVVEHQPDVLVRTSEILAGIGHHFVSVECFEKARQALTEYEFSYVLAAITAPILPEGELKSYLNGREFFNEVHGAKPELPIVFTAGPKDCTRGQAVRLTKLGVADIVMPPNMRQEYERPLSAALKDLAKELDAIQAPAIQSVQSGLASQPKHTELSLFSEGELVLFPSRVELCGVEILSDTGLGHSRRMLELLSEMRNGRFVRMSADELARQMRQALGGADIGVGTITGCAKHIRGNIKDRLPRDRGLKIEAQDVLVRDDQGYHLNDEKIKVRKVVSDDADLDDSSADQQDTYVLPNDLSNVPSTCSHDPSNVLPAADLNERQLWILAQARKGGKVTRAAVEEVHGVSMKTAQRDFRALVALGLVEYVRKPHPGHYRLIATH